MNFDDYLNQFNSGREFDIKTTLTEQVIHWFYRHPATVKTIKWAAFVFSIGLTLQLPISFLLSHEAPIALAAAGGITLAVTRLAQKSLSLIVSPYRMSSHVFTPQECKGGQLYYQGDIPVLTLYSDDPYEAGWAHGYLTGNVLYQLRNQWKLIFQHLAKDPKPQEVPHVIEAIRNQFPHAFLLEIRGLAAGFNHWMNTQRWLLKPDALTEEEIILYHLLPDSMHFSARMIEKDSPLQENKAPQVACTVVIDRDRKEGIAFGRNMDWPSFGLTGTYTLIMNRRFKHSHVATVEVGLPGFIGTLTGMNNHGLCVAMNVCSGNTFEIKGMPAAFFNRLCLEQCHRVPEVIETLRRQPPLGPYHLIVADSHQAQSIHLYQGEADEPHYSRILTEQGPLIVTNCCYSPWGEESCHMHFSQKRKEVISHLFADAQSKISPEQLGKAKLVAYSLSLPYVNNYITTHHIMMYPESKRMQVAFNNAYAGESPLQELHTKQLLHLETKSKIS